MATMKQLQDICTLVEAHVRLQGNEVGIVGGDVGSYPHTSLRLDFSDPVNIDTEEMERALGMPVELSEDGLSLTFYRPE